MKRFAIVGLAIALSSAAAPAQYSAQFIEISRAWGSAVADFNGDGHDDIYITGHDEDDRIWYWTASGYVPSPQTFVWVDRHDCDAADINLDGRVDLYCSVGADKGRGTGPKEVWIQGADGIFRLAQDHGAEDPYGRGRLVLFLDFNRDGYPDIFLTNEGGRADSHPSENHLFVNQSGAHFTEVITRATGNHGFQCAAKGDINRDGWDDLVVCELDRTPHVYLNDRAGDFIELITPALSGNWRDAKLADMNGDGADDLVVITSSNQVQIWLNQSSAVFYSTPAFTNQLELQGKSLAIGDFNHDGWQDVYVVLQKADCQKTLHDVAADVVYEGRPSGTWVRVRQPQDYDGCGHLAQTVDGDKVLLMNGGVGYRGPNYVIQWNP